MTTITTPDLAAAYTRLNAAAKAHDNASAELVHAALATFAAQVPAFFPHAVAVVLAWSDQGDWLTVRALFDEAEDLIEWDAYTDEGDELDDIACNLDEHNAAIWQPFMTRINPEETADVYRLDLAAAVRRLAETTTPTTTPTPEAQR